MPDPARAISVLTTMLEFFAGGQRWIKDSMFDQDGNRCLIGARLRVQGQLGIEGRDASHYLRMAVAPFERLPSDIHLMLFNDRCATYDEIRAAILKARDLAQAELDGQSDRRRGHARSRRDSALVQIKGEELR